MKERPSEKPSLMYGSILRNSSDYDEYRIDLEGSKTSSDHAVKKAPSALKRSLLLIGSLFVIASAFILVSAFGENGLVNDSSSFSNYLSAAISDISKLGLPTGANSMIGMGDSFPTNVTEVSTTPTTISSDLEFKFFRVDYTPLDLADEVFNYKFLEVRF